MESHTNGLEKILRSNEQVQLYIRKKIHRSKFVIDLVAITNERVILKHAPTPELENGYTDYNYQVIQDIVLRGVLRSTLRITLKSTEEPILLDDLSNSDAQKAYEIITENLARFSQAAP